METKASNFLNIKGLPDLANILDINIYKLVDMVAKPGYRSFSIPKKKGGERVIHAPKKKLAKVQKNLNGILQYLYQEKRAVQGFISNKYSYYPHGILANAQAHLGMNYIWNIDLVDFFPSISTHRIKETFESAPFNFVSPIASYITLICSYQKQLPIGAPSSPMLSNYVCRNLDENILAWIYQAREKNIEVKYTRYADDMTFSFMEKPSEGLQNEIIQLIHEQGFQLNPKKNRLQAKHQAQWVTGIKVNEKPNLDRRKIRKLRAIIHHAQTAGLEEACKRYYKLETVPVEAIEKFILSIGGKINYVAYVRGRTDSVFLKLFVPFQKLRENYLNKEN